MPSAPKILTLSLLICFAAATLARATPPKQTFIGTITDSMCEKADHSQMQMGPTDAACAMACVSIHGAEYVLYDGKDVYLLSDQKATEKFAGEKVKITGTLDAKTKKILVESISAAK